MHACTNHSFCIKDALQKADLLCHKKGLRFTPLRRKVLHMIWANHSPAKAYDILDKLKEEDASAKPPTVYRSLDFLMENGLIHKLNRLNAYVGCSHPLKHKACYFLICKRCDEVKECCNSALDHVLALTSQENKFQPKHISVEIEGECQECQKEKALYEDAH